MARSEAFDDLLQNIEDVRKKRSSNKRLLSLVTALIILALVAALT